MVFFVQILSIFVVEEQNCFKLLPISEQIFYGSHGYVSRHLYSSFIQVFLNHLAMRLKLTDLGFVREWSGMTLKIILIV